MFENFLENLFLYKFPQKNKRMDLNQGCLGASSAHTQNERVIGFKLRFR